MTDRWHCYVLPTRVWTLESRFTCQHCHLLCDPGWVIYQESQILIKKNRHDEASLGGLMLKNPPASAGDTGLIPGPGRSHMSRSNY